MTLHTKETQVFLLEEIHAKWAFVCKSHYWFHNLWKNLSQSKIFGIKKKDLGTFNDCYIPKNTLFTTYVVFSYGSTSFNLYKRTKSRNKKKKFRSKIWLHVSSKRLDIFGYIGGVGKCHRKEPSWRGEVWDFLKKLIVVLFSLHVIIFFLTTFPFFFLVTCNNRMKNIKYLHFQLYVHWVFHYRSVYLKF